MAGIPLVVVLLVGFCGPLVRAEVEYAWTWTVGGPGEDHAGDVAVDLEGNVFVTGWFTGAVDFGAAGEGDVRESEGGRDIFVAKLKVGGDAAWIRTVGGPGRDVARALAVGSEGDVVIAGWFHGTVDFDPNDGVDEHTADGVYEDAFVTKLRADGGYAWTRTFGAAGTDRAQGVAVDSYGNVLVTGAFRYTVDFDAGPGTDEHTSSGGYDVFVTKLTPDGDHVWTRTMGGKASDLGFAVAADLGGSVFVTGGYRDAADFDPGSAVDAHDGGGAFVTKLAANGSYGWTRTFGRNDEALGWDIAVDPVGSAVVTGYYFTFNSLDFDPSDAFDFRSTAGWTDSFAMKLYADGTYGWTYTVGGTFDDCGMGVAVAAGDRILVTGRFQKEPDFDPTDGVEKRASSAWHDAYVTWLAAGGAHLGTSTLGGAGYDDGSYTVAAGAGGDTVLAGRFELAVDFDPTDGVDRRDASGSFDAFVSRLTWATPPAPGDLDGDGAVGGDDFARFGVCLGGPGLTMPPTQCHPVDFVASRLDGDGDVDLRDFAVFQGFVGAAPGRRD